MDWLYDKMVLTADNAQKGGKEEDIFTFVNKIFVYKRTYIIASLKLKHYSHEVSSL